MLIKLIGSLLLGLISFNSFSQSVGTKETEIADQIIFEKLLINGDITERKLEHYSWGWQEMPRHFSKKTGSGYVHMIGTTGKKEGQEIQEISLTLKSINTFSENPIMHLAILGKSEGTLRYNRGRGIIIGYLNGIIPTFGATCPTGVRLQPETWSEPTINNGNTYNHLWGSEYCSSRTFEDDKEYEINLSLGINSYYYKVIEKNTGVLITQNLVYDGPGVNSDYEIINNKLEGITLGLVFADNVPKKSWQLIFKDIKYSWK
jgi:hypothetical protein